MGTSNFETKTYNASNVHGIISKSDLAEDLISSSSMLVRRELRKFETFHVLSQVTNGDEILSVMLQTKAARTELQKAMSSLGGLNDILQGVFGSQGRVRSKVPAYNSFDVLAAVEKSKYYSDYTSDTRLLVAALMNDMLDVFEMRESESVSSWLRENPGDLHITPDELVSQILEASITDKIKHELQKFRKDVKSPSGQFVIHSFSQRMYMTFREISNILSEVDFREEYIRDVIQLLARSIVGDRSQNSSYGELRHNTAITALKTCSSLVRIAMSEYDSTHICSIPAQELRPEAEFIARQLSGLTNYELIHDARIVANCSGYERWQGGVYSSLMVWGTRRSEAKAHVYRIVDDIFVNRDYVDATNVTKKIGNRVPSVPADMLNTVTTDLIIATESLLLEGSKNKLNSIVLAKSGIADELMHDAAAILCSIQYSLNEADNYKADFLINSGNGRLRALLPLKTSQLLVKSALVALCNEIELTDRVVTRPLYQTEAVIVDGRFYGVWSDRPTTPLNEVKMKIIDLFDEETEASIELPIFGEARSLPPFLELQVTEGWADIVEVLNSIGRDLNAPGSQKSLAIRSMWLNRLVAMLAHWVNNDLIVGSLIHSAIFKLAHAKYELSEKGSTNLEEHYSLSTPYRGMVALQVSVGLIETMANLSDEECELSDEVKTLIFTPETLARFGELVGVGAE